MAAKRKAADSKSTQSTRTEPFSLPSVTVVGRQIRFILMDRNNTFYLSSDLYQSGCQPLFLGSDVLAGIKQDTKNHHRIHARFATQGLAAKLVLTDVRIESIHNCGMVWFYSMLGMFQAVFEYHTMPVQKHCLQHFTDIWLQVSTEALLEEAYSVSPSNWVSSLTPEIHRLLHSEVYLSTPLASAGMDDTKFKSWEAMASRSIGLDDSRFNSLLHTATGTVSSIDGCMLKGVMSSGPLDLMPQSSTTAEGHVHCSNSDHVEFTQVQTVCDRVDCEALTCQSCDVQRILSNNDGASTVSGSVVCEQKNTDDVSVPHKQIKIENECDLSIHNKITVDSCCCAAPYHSKECDCHRSKHFSYKQHTCSVCLSDLNSDMFDINNFILSDIILKWTDYVQRVKKAFDVSLKAKQTCNYQTVSSSGAKCKPGSYNTKHKHKAESKHGYGECDAQSCLCQLEYVELVLDFLQQSLHFLTPSTEHALVSKLLCLVLSTLEVGNSSEACSDEWSCLPPGKSAALTAFSRWLGEEFHHLEPLISQRVASFKQAHIENICNLPPAEEVVSELFPPCMVELARTWTGLQELRTADSLQMDHSYEQGRKVAERSRTQNRNLFPIIQLILELANNTLVSGVAHVVYCQLRHVT